MSEEYSLKALGGKSYYVSSSAGNDSNDGLSEQTPIKTLRQASKITLEPGDRLLFRRGDVWERESLFPKGSGTADIPIELGAYGSGEDRPWIKPGMTQLYGIRIVNTGGYRITGLEISNCFGGLVVWEENTYNHEYMWVEDCYFHDMTTKTTTCRAIRPTCFTEWASASPDRMPTAAARCSRTSRSKAANSTVAMWASR